MQSGGFVSTAHRFSCLFQSSVAGNYTFGFKGPVASGQAWLDGTPLLSTAGTGSVSACVTLTAASTYALEVRMHLNATDTNDESLFAWWPGCGPIPAWATWPWRTCRRGCAPWCS